jgi:hypothetical protein
MIKKTDVKKNRHRGSYAAPEAVEEKKKLKEVTRDSKR